MGVAIVSPDPVPFKGTQAGLTAVTPDSNNGAALPTSTVASPNTSQAIELAYAPIYPRSTIYHRASSLVSTTGITAGDTADNAHDPTAVPTWIGVVNATLGAGGTVLHVLPYGKYGPPPASGNAYLSAGAGATQETATISASGVNALVDYTITVGATTQIHTVGDYVVVLAAVGVSTNNASSIPSGPLGGPGSNWIDFRCYLTAGAAQANATVMPRQWDDLLHRFVDTSSVPLQAAASGSAYQLIRVETHGGWYYCQSPAPAFTGTGAALLITASVG